MKKVLFVCLGNICRSPTAHGVFREIVARRGLSEQISIDSAGTAAYHIGNPPDHRSAVCALQRGYDLSDLRARQAVTADFSQFDYILAMDAQNLSDLESICPSDYQGHLGCFWILRLSRPGKYLIRIMVARKDLIMCLILLSQRPKGCLGIWSGIFEC